MAIMNLFREYLFEAEERKSENEEKAENPIYR
jgi:hypothetical protein